MKRLFLFLLCILPGMLFAEPVTFKRAESIAYQFFNKSVRAVRKTTLHMIWDGESKHSRASVQPAFYVFNAEGGQGFVIVSADDCSTPILGYSFEGEFVVEGMPENVKALYASYRDDIFQARQKGTKPTAGIREEWKTLVTKTSVGNLELKSAKWYQMAPYNNETPKHPNGKHCLTGCVATATSIVMYAHRHPARGDGKTLPGYFAATERVDCPAVTYNKPYEWNKMIPDYNNGYTDEQGNAVARLMHHVGHGIQMDYGLHVSNSTIRKAATFLRDHMGYSPAITIKSASEFANAAAWAEALRKELQKGFPIVISGSNRNEGHAFVLDGFHEDGTFGVNLGWGGKNNGYYQLSAIPGGWNVMQNAIFNMRPKTDGEKAPDILKFVQSGINPAGILINKKGEEIQSGESFTLELGGLQNPAFSKFPCKLMVAMVDNYDNIVEIVAQNDHFIADGSYDILTQDFGVVSISGPIFPGYRLRAYYILENGERLMIEGNANIPWEILLRADSVPAPETAYTVSTTASDNHPDHAMSTFSSSYATTPSSEEVVAYWAEQQNNETVVLKKITPQGNRLVIPAHTGVVLSTPAAQTFQMKVVENTPSADKENNLLRATGDQAVQVEKSVNAYILSKKSNQLMFYRLSDTDRTIQPNHAYLVLPNHVSVHNVKFVFGEVTGIEKVQSESDKDAPVYDLSGRVVHHPVKGGVYIQNGKKYILK